ncbi:hypothetical protein BAE44_0022275 [Dichanthelium oligosanthes]|uniref:Uncharacterized protein n=1 Tax=Dichanthelium oligosanthes TaxID=888268 RepID=A0A1E5UUZ3_9POAL|nr:hypothetical protein BAE44_0022275 [Dichanthelium oligosanthes]
MESGSGKEQQMQIVCVRSASTGAAGDGEEWAEEQSSRSALSLFKEKEEEIERKKLEVRDKVFSMLGRVEEETKRLAFIRQELEVMADPTRREVDAIRKRIDKVNKQLKPLGKTCIKKVQNACCRYFCMLIDCFLLVGVSQINTGRSCVCVSNMIVEQEKEYKMCLDAYNEKSNEKATLVNRLMELVSESERLRMKKLEELNKTIESLY